MIHNYFSILFMQQTKQKLKKNQENSSKKESQNLKTIKPKDKIEDLFDLLLQNVGIFKKIKNSQLANVAQIVKTSVLDIRKYLKYMNEFNQKLESKHKQLQLKYNNTFNCLKNVSIDNLKLKQQIIELYGQIQEKDAEIQKLSISNKLNVSYASSISYREDSQKDSSQANQMAIEQRSFRSSNDDYSDGLMDSYASDSQDNIITQEKKQQNESYNTDIITYSLTNIYQRQISQTKKSEQIREKKLEPMLPTRNFLSDIIESYQGSLESNQKDYSKRKDSDELLISQSDKNSVGGSDQQ